VLVLDVSEVGQLDAEAWNPVARASLATQKNAKVKLVNPRRSSEDARATHLNSVFESHP